MIIIKIIILYFIQIRHIDDFPSTGTPACNISLAEAVMPVHNTVTGPVVIFKLTNHCYV